jgi:hypothetical protein
MIISVANGYLWYRWKKNVKFGRNGPSGPIPTYYFDPFPYGYEIPSIFLHYYGSFRCDCSFGYSSWRGFHIFFPPIPKMFICYTYWFWNNCVNKSNIKITKILKFSFYWGKKFEINLDQTVLKFFPLLLPNNLAVAIYFVKMKWK